MTDSNLRYQVVNVMIAALPPIPDGTCTSDITTDMADVMLSTAAELAWRSKRPRRSQDWCAGSGVEVEMNRKQREKARRRLRADPQETFEIPRRELVNISGRFARLPSRASSGSSYANSKHDSKKAIRPTSTNI